MTAIRIHDSAGGGSGHERPTQTFVSALRAVYRRFRESGGLHGRINLHVMLGGLVIAFLALPIVMFAQFHAERRHDETLLLKAMRDQMTTIGAALSAEIRTSGLNSYAVLDDRLKSLTPPDMRIKILYRPFSGQLNNAFLYVATSEEIDRDRLSVERDELLRVGVLDALRANCSIDGGDMFRFGAGAGKEELVIGVVPVRAVDGCWAVVASYAKGGFLDSAVARPFWQIPRVQFALTVYAVMALILVGVVLRVHHTIQALRETASAISDNLDTPAQFAAVSEVSELDSTAETLDRMVDELRRARLEAVHASEAKTRYLANISHELRTPLNAIIGFSQVIEKEMFGPIGEQRYVDYAADIHSSGRYLLGMINDVLDLTRLEAGRFELAIEEIDPTDNIGWAVRLLAGEARKHRHTVDVSIPDTLPPLAADKRAFRSILVNLVSNAIKYTPEGGHIAVSARLDEDGKLALSVADNGDGIAPEDMARVFEPYGRASDARTAAREGTGLGLPLVRHLAELHGGRLDFVSTVGVGTRATVVLPCLERVELPVV